MLAGGVEWGSGSASVYHFPSDIAAVGRVLNREWGKYGRRSAGHPGDGAARSTGFRYGRSNNAQPPDGAGCRCPNGVASRRA